MKPLIHEEIINKNENSQSNDELLILDSFDEPNRADSHLWKKSVERTIFRGAKTYFILKGKLCLLVGHADKLEPIQIQYPSSIDYRAGTYYDAISELNDQNCESAQYAVMDLDQSFSQFDINIKIKYLNVSLPKRPSLPLFVQLEPYAFNLGINKGKYVEDHTGALEALELLAQHRIQPIKSWISSNQPVDGETTSFINFVGKHKNGPTNLPDSSKTKEYAKHSTSPWFYVIDEPSENNASEVQKMLDHLKEKFPEVKRMVTTDISYPVTGIDIYCPVMDHLYNREEYSGELWSYVSCMSHGCGENRSYLDNPSIFDVDQHPRSGVPDLTIDAPNEDIFAFFLIGKHLKLGALLYYDSITQWSLASKGIDIDKDMYNFGGNGDGTLLYPDYINKRARPSLRLKLIREASYLADLVTIKNLDLKEKIQSTTDWNINLSIRDEIYKNF
ncbi:MAG: hypothetical protein Fur0010_28300 [Bdellovibrio sp.]